MTIRYEANPPKILSDTDTDKSILKFVEKIKIISKKCDAIHLTENVLGHQRVSPIIVGEIIKREIPKHADYRKSEGQRQRRRRDCKDLQRDVQALVFQEFWY